VAKLRIVENGTKLRAPLLEIGAETNPRRQHVVVEAVVAERKLRRPLQVDEAVVEDAGKPRRPPEVVEVVVSVAKPQKQSEVVVVDEAKPRRYFEIIAASLRKFSKEKRLLRTLAN